MNLSYCPDGPLEPPESRPEPEPDYDAIYQRGIDEKYEREFV